MVGGAGKHEVGDRAASYPAYSQRRRSRGVPRCVPARLGRFQRQRGFAAPWGPLPKIPVGIRGPAPAIQGRSRGSTEVACANPFDQVLDASLVRGRSCIEYSFHFIVVLFAFDYVRRWLGEVGTVFLCFFIGSKKRVMEHGVDAPSRW